jgi:hypothetical protein
MGNTMNGLDRLGSHVSGSLEQARNRADAAARVRARLARGERPAGARTTAPRARVRRGAVLGALAMAAAVLVVAFAAWRAEHRALTFVIGGKAESGAVGAFLAAPNTGELPLSFSDGTRVGIAPGARARVAEITSRGARLLVESGVVSANVVHRDDTRWLVDAGPFEVKVTGTRFDVAWQPAEQAIIVTLHEGSVVVSGCGLADGQRVSAGQQLHASCKLGTATLGPITAEALPSPAGIPAALLSTAAPAPVAAAEPTTTAASSLPDAPRAPPAHASPLDAPASASASAVASASASASAVASASELLARANADRYAGRFEAATESLETVRGRFRGSEASATAAFELGRIAFDRHHDFAAAGDWFDTYLRERPAGALAREALGRAIESRHRAGDSERAAKLAARYLATYPGGPHATLAHRLAGRDGETP